MKGARAHVYTVAAVNSQCCSKARRRQVKWVVSWLVAVKRRARTHLWICAEHKRIPRSFWRSIWTRLQDVLAHFTSRDSLLILWSTEASEHRGGEDKSIGGRESKWQVPKGTPLAVTAKENDGLICCHNNGALWSKTKMNPFHLLSGKETHRLKKKLPPAKPIVFCTFYI